MASKGGSLVDLSDLDPYHAPLRSESPRIFTTMSAPSADGNSNATAPRPPPPLPSQAVSNGQDPLDSFASLIDLSNEPSGARTSGLREVVRAHDERQEQVLTDLARDPWGAPPPPLLSGSGAGAGREPAPAPLPVRRPSRRREESANSASFSPPRRLSGLMDSHIFATSASPPHSIPIPTTSRPSLDPYHPSSPPPHSAENTFRKIRRASMDRLPTMARTTEPSTSPDWGDFHSAASPPPSEAHAPPTFHYTTNSQPSATSSHSNLASGSSSPFLHRRPSPNPPSNGNAHRLPPQGNVGARSNTVPITKKEWQYDPRAPDAVQPIVLGGVRPGVQQALDEDIAEGVSLTVDSLHFPAPTADLIPRQIRPSLPPRIRISTKWNLLYSLDQHGISIGTMYERMKVGLRGSSGGVVLVVKDGRGSVFGAYVNEALKEGASYYGDGTWSARLFLSLSTSSLTRIALNQLPVEVYSISSYRLPRRFLHQSLQMDRSQRLHRPHRAQLPLGWRRRWQVRSVDRRRL